MKSKFKKSFFGYNVWETDEYLCKLISDLEKEKNEYEMKLQVLVSECSALEENKNNISDEAEKAKLAIKNLNTWLTETWDQFRMETEDTLKNYQSDEERYLKEYTDLKNEYEADVSLLNNMVKDIFSKTSELKKSLAGGAS